MAAAEIEHRQFHIGELDMHVLLAGTGEPLLLLHGFPDSAQLWRKMIPALVGAGYRVIAPDQRGFGRTAAPEGVGPYRIDRIAADAIGLLDALGIEKAALMGHDWGAAIGWALASAHPDRFSRYVALSVGHLNAYASAGLRQKLKGWYVLVFQLRGLAEAMFSAGNFAFPRRWLGDPPEMPHWIADLSRPGRLTAGINWYRANIGPLLRPSFGRVQIPVLGVWSTGDIALAEEQMTASAGFCDAGFEYRRLDGVGHWIPLDAPDEAAALVLDFLGRTSAAF
ncbi:alpha/beta fold hydrolase [Phenylobacterium montanum]|uniref:Alpha/beta hydrolase n=1 Tax=Phenylobacterium montanum TaxID=2823693 RepID=A0A975IWC3_9CAUL|nr:alpha/beta hydrolase [Caulobacter sp. S6]QUD89685.1 alpha/beta hydrolase [Caulobacter sp. S6]